MKSDERRPQKKERKMKFVVLSFILLFLCDVRAMIGSLKGWMSNLHGKVTRAGRSTRNSIKGQLKNPHLKHHYSGVEMCEVRFKTRLMQTKLGHHTHTHTGSDGV